MKSVFVDTNILIDLIANRPPFSKYAIGIFDKAQKNDVKLYTSTHSYATTHYVLKKYLGEKELREVLILLLDIIELIPVNPDMIRNSLFSAHKDFEDAIQIFAANSINNLDYIVTRNLKDFKDASIPVLAPDELLKCL